MAHLERGRLEQGAEGGTRDQLGDLVPDDVHSQHLVGGAVGDHLAEAGVLAPDGGTAVGAQREDAAADLPSRLARLLLGESERADLRGAVALAPPPAAPEQTR